MGTNFYWLTPAVQLPTGEALTISLDDPKVHIGKRSAAGLYCWDCGVTLCKYGESRIHYRSPGDSGWHSVCPKCGRGPDTETLDDSSAGVELGFAKPRRVRPTGVRTCSSWSWAQTPATVERVCHERPDDVLIENEYGDQFTGREFLEMLESNCPVRFTDSIGHWFS